MSKEDNAEMIFQALKEEGAIILLPSKDGFIQVSGLMNDLHKYSPEDCSVIHHYFKGLPIFFLRSPASEVYQLLEEGKIRGGSDER